MTFNLTVEHSNSIFLSIKAINVKVARVYDLSFVVFQQKSRLFHVSRMNLENLI